MKKWLVLFLFLLLTPAFASAQSDTYIYGGSGVDTLGGVAVSSDGRILLTGYTESSDGTLEDRTKNGPAGWVLCIDHNGEVLWNFCRHYARYERMETPVFQPDGSATVVFWTEQGGIGRLELLSLSPEGQLLSITPLIEAADNMIHVRTCGFIPETGYVVQEMNKRTQSLRLMVFGLDGQYVCDLDHFDEDDPLSALFPNGTRVTLQDIEQNNGDVQVTFEADEPTGI
ncbi:MAG: hypothetical protein E7331_02070 [Clostridiales bacterium]|nr:hypothetical protein [Clostridiales bacterium]